VLCSTGAKNSCNPSEDRVTQTAAKFAPLNLHVSVAVGVPTALPGSAGRRMI